MPTTVEDRIAAVRRRAKNFTLDMWDKVCRLCLTKNDLTICTPKDEEFIIHYEVFTKQWYDPTNLPNKICRNCLTLNNIGYDFILKSLDTYNTKQRIINEEKRKIMEGASSSVSDVEETCVSGVIVKSNNKARTNTNIIDLTESEPQDEKFVQIIPNSAVTQVQLEENFAKTPECNILAKTPMNGTGLRELVSDNTLSSSTENPISNDINWTSSMQYNSKDLERNTKDIINMKKNRILRQLKVDNTTKNCNINASCSNVNNIQEENQNKFSKTTISSEIIEISDDSNSSSSFNLHNISSDIKIAESIINLGCDMEITERIPENISSCEVIILDEELAELPPTSQPENDLSSGVESSDNDPDDNNNLQNNTTVQQKIRVRPDLFQTQIKNYKETSPRKIIPVQPNDINDVQLTTSPITARNSQRRRIRFSDKTDVSEVVTHTPAGNAPAVRGILKQFCSITVQDSGQSTVDPINTNEVTSQSRAVDLIGSNPELRFEQSNDLQEINNTPSTTTNQTQLLISVNELLKDNAKTIPTQKILNSAAAKETCDDIFEAIKKRRK